MSISYHSNLLVNEIQDMSDFNCFFSVLRLVNLRARLATLRGLCKNSTCGYLRLLTIPFVQGLRLIIEKKLFCLNITLWEARWPHGLCARLRSERSWFEPWPDIVLCSWARHTVPTSTLVYKWVNANLLLLGNPAMDKHPIQGKVEILLVASCYGNRDKLWPDEPLCSYADLP